MRRCWRTTWTPGVRWRKTWRVLGRRDPGFRLSRGRGKKSGAAKIWQVNFSFPSVIYCICRNPRRFKCFQLHQLCCGSRHPGGQHQQQHQQQQQQSEQCGREHKQCQQCGCKCEQCRGKYCDCNARQEEKKSSSTTKSPGENPFKVMISSWNKENKSLGRG